MAFMNPKMVPVVLSTNEQGASFKKLVLELEDRGLAINLADERSGQIMGSGPDDRIYVISQTPGITDIMETKTVRALNPSAPQMDGKGRMQTKESARGEVGGLFSHDRLSEVPAKYR